MMSQFGLVYAYKDLWELAKPKLKSEYILDMFPTQYPKTNSIETAVCSKRNSHTIRCGRKERDASLDSVEQTVTLFHFE